MGAGRGLLLAVLLIGFLGLGDSERGIFPALAAVFPLHFLGQDSGDLSFRVACVKQGAADGKVPAAGVNLCSLVPYIKMLSGCFPCCVRVG